MRTLCLLVLALAALSVFGCKTYSSKSRVVNSEATERTAPRIEVLHILPAELPDEFHGALTEQDAERYRRDWPMAAARTVAEGVTDRSEKRITGFVAQEKPEEGHYFEVNISYLDVGDPEARAASVVGGKREGWSLVLATGKVVDAKTGEVVLELEFSQSSGYRFKTPFENDMYNLGRELADCLEGRKR